LLFLAKPEPPTKKFKANIPTEPGNEGNGCVVDDNTLTDTVIAPTEPDRYNEQNDDIQTPRAVLSPIVPIRLSDIFSEQASHKEYISIKVIH
jgi:hypothetical protein